MEVSTRYSSAATRTLLALMPLYFGGRLGLFCDGGRFETGEEGIKSSKECRAHCETHCTTVDTHQGGHCWWIFLHMYLVKVIVALVFLCVKCKVKINPKMRLQRECEAKNVVCFRPCSLAKKTAGSLKALADSATAGLINLRNMHRV